MVPHADWNPLLKDLEKLHRLWLTKAEAEANDKRWIRGVLFGIETGWNRIAEEVAKPSPNIGSMIADWRRHLNSTEEAAAQEASRGVDYGIKLVIECVTRFYKRAIPHGPPRSRHAGGANGDQSEEVS